SSLKRSTASRGIYESPYAAEREKSYDSASPRAITIHGTPRARSSQGESAMKTSLKGATGWAALGLALLVGSTQGVAGQVTTVATQPSTDRSVVAHRQ